MYKIYKMLSYYCILLIQNNRYKNRLILEKVFDIILYYNYINHYSSSNLNSTTSTNGILMTTSNFSENISLK